MKRNKWMLTSRSQLCSKHFEMSILLSLFGWTKMATSGVSKRVVSANPVSIQISIKKLITNYVMSCKSWKAICYLRHRTQTNADVSMLKLKNKKPKPYFSLSTVLSPFLISKVWSKLKFLSCYPKIIFWGISTWASVLHFSPASCTKSLA